MGQIILEGIELYAYHGVLEEEQRTGNRFGVDLFIEADLDQAARTDRLSDTVDYSKVYTVIENEMKIRSQLLENVGYRIIKSIRDIYPEIQKITVHISKFNPPVGGIAAKSKIILEG